MKTKTFLPAIILTALTVAFSVDGSTIFSDDFTDASVTNAAWRNTGTGNQLAVTVGNGSLTVANTETFRGPAELIRELGDAQTSEFTITYVQKSATQRPRYAGLVFCRVSAADGYIVLLEDNQIIVGHVVDGANPDVIFSHQSRDVLSGDNEITVSKRGSEFNIFLNGVFQGTFTDSRFNSGDVSFLLMPNSAATFGAIEMTSTFKEREIPTTFSDNFDDGLHRYWNNVTQNIAALNGVLHINALGTAEQTYVDFPMTLFEAQVDVRFVSGARPHAAPYGIILTGRVPLTDNTFTIRYVYFLIDDTGYAFVGNDGGYRIVLDPPGPYQAINLGPTNLSNRINVVRKDGANNYEFFVNGEKIIDVPLADFTITGIGLFVGSNTNVEFDNFTVTRSGDIPSSIRQPRQFTRSQNRVNTNRSQLNNSFYDMRGRRVYSANPTSRNARRPVAAGMYVNEERKDVRLRRR